MQDQYLELLPVYERLGQSVKGAIESFVREAQVSVLSVDYRVKTFESFATKVERKKYIDPFNQLTDFCGVRVVVFYPSDIDVLNEIFQNEFDIVEQADKQENMSPDQFGYRSRHYLAKLKNTWLEAPNFRGLEDCIFEIQLRTILMHAWADLSHQLAYKEIDQVPIQFQREINQLSALLEVADGVIDRLRADRALYRDSLKISDDVSGSGIFELSAPLNLDSLSEFLDFYFMDRRGDIVSTSSLLNDLKVTGIGFTQILDGYERIRELLPEFEVQTYSEADGHDREIMDLMEDHQDRWHQVGVVRHILDLTCDEWWEMRLNELPYHVIEATNQQRKMIQPVSDKG